MSGSGHQPVEGSGPTDRSSDAGVVGARGRFRIYLGAAPGVGKTYAMLSEGRRRKERGADVVLGFVECHGRRRTEALMEDLEVVRPLVTEYRGSRFEEMDLDAVLERHSQVVLVDELAHTNVPGSGPAREAVAGRRGDPGRGDRGHHDRQHPTSGEHRRRGGADHRSADP